MTTWQKLHVHVFVKSGDKQLTRWCSPLGCLCQDPGPQEGPADRTMETGSATGEKTINLIHSKKPWQHDESQRVHQKCYYSVGFSSSRQFLSISASFFIFTFYLPHFLEICYSCPENTHAHTHKHTQSACMHAHTHTHTHTHTVPLSLTWTPPRECKTLCMEWVITAFTSCGRKQMHHNSQPSDFQCMTQH